jgi:hypothetical protein
MPEQPSPSLSGDGLLERAGKALTLVAALLLVLSAAFDYSYLLALGLAFEDVPTSLADHIRSALVWAPKCAIYALVIAIYEVTMSRLERGQTEDELVRRSPNPLFTRWFRRSPHYLFGVLVAAMVVKETLYTTSSRGIYIAALVAWGTLAAWVVAHERLGSRFNQTGRRLFVIVPMVGIWVGFLGYSQGRSVLEAQSPSWTVSLKTETAPREQKLLGLRRFSASAVLVTSDRKVVVVPGESIVSASLDRSPAESPHLLCIWLQIDCKSPTQSK